MTARWWMRGSAVAVSALITGATASGAQLTTRGSWEGQINYAVTGASIRDESNAADPCNVSTSRSATLSGIPGGATVLAAWLYWAGSGSLDASVTFAGSGISADRTWTTSYFYGGSNLTFFGAAEDVTALVPGNGTYTLSGLAVRDNGPHCDFAAVMGGWSLFVVYRDPSAPLRRIEMRDGFSPLRNGNVTITMTGFLGATTPGARLTLLSWEGDSDISGDGTNPEVVRFNGTTVSTPSNNAFNSTANGATSYGHDLDTFDASSVLGAGARTASIQLSTGGDLILPHALMSSVNIQLVDVTPKGLASPVVRLGGGAYSQTFQVENASDSTEQYDIIARVTGAPAPFITIDSVTGPGMIGVRTRPDSMRASLARQTTQPFVVWYRVAAGGSADNVEFLLARSVEYPTALEARSEGWQEIRRGGPTLTLAKSVSPNVNIAPGIDLTYTTIVGNSGAAPAQGIVVSEVVPVETEFKLASPGQTLPAGMTAVVDYSLDGSTWTYTPVSAGCSAAVGYDACVRAVRWRLTGTLAANGAQTATLTFVARVR